MLTRDGQWLQPFLESFAVEKEFRLDPSILGITFDTEFMLHDMLYTHPGIFILRRRTPS